jgi:hypothetical protein
MKGVIIIIIVFAMACGRVRESRKEAFDARSCLAKIPTRAALECNGVEHLDPFGQRNPFTVRTIDQCVAFWGNFLKSRCDARNPAGIFDEPRDGSSPHDCDVRWVTYAAAACSGAADTRPTPIEPVVEGYPRTEWIAISEKDCWTRWHEFAKTHLCPGDVEPADR